MKEKLQQLLNLLDEMVDLTAEPRSREENLELARMLDDITSYRMVDIESNLLDAVTNQDMQRINSTNAQEILAEYPAGFYRSELRGVAVRKGPVT